MFATLKTASGRPAPLGFVQKRHVAELVSSGRKTELLEVADPLPLPEVTEVVPVVVVETAPAIVNLRGKDRWGNMLWKNGHRTESSLMNAEVPTGAENAISTAEIAKRSRQTEKRVLAHFAYQVSKGDKIGRALNRLNDGRWFVTE